MKLHKNLIRRYLLWAYKTTRESFERIERKTTQLEVDRYLLTALKGMPAAPKHVAQDYQIFVEDFKQYIDNKAQDELKQKYVDGKTKTLHPQYLYLKNRLAAIEKAIKYFLGLRELKAIETLFEAEFTERILKAKEH